MCVYTSKIIENKNAFIGEERVKTSELWFSHVQHFATLGSFLWRIEGLEKDSVPNRPHLWLQLEKRPSSPCPLPRRTTGKKREGSQNLSLALKSCSTVRSLAMQGLTQKGVFHSSPQVVSAGGHSSSWTSASCPSGAILKPFPARFPSEAYCCACWVGSIFRNLRLSHSKTAAMPGGCDRKAEETVVDLMSRCTALSIISPRCPT